MAKTAITIDPVKLTRNQQTLRDEIANKLIELTSRNHANGTKTGDIQRLGQKAAELHKLLKDSSVTVRHHKYMIENRGCSPDEPGFYKNVHAIEDLLKFIDNQAANDDPEDRTINDDFEFRVFSRRWDRGPSGQPDIYRFKRTRSGWTIKPPLQGPIAAAKDGRVGGRMGTGLFYFLDHDSINYPEELPGYLERLWERAAKDGLTHDEVQAGMTMLAKWVRLVEENSPVAGVFESFK